VKEQKLLAVLSNFKSGFCAHNIRAVGILGLCINSKKNLCLRIEQVFKIYPQSGVLAEEFLLLHTEQVLFVFVYQILS
jgi:hypothetical protein